MFAVVLIASLVVLGLFVVAYAVLALTRMLLGAATESGEYDVFSISSLLLGVAVSIFSLREPKMPVDTAIDFFSTSLVTAALLPTRNLFGTGPIFGVSVIPLQVIGGVLAAVAVTSLFSQEKGRV